MPNVTKRLFVDRMIRIIARGRQGIEEHARSLIERDTMFPKVRGGADSWR